MNETTLVTLSLKGTRCSYAALRAVQDRYRYSDLRRNDSFFGLWPHSRATDRMVINDYGLLYRSATKIQAVYRARKDRQMAWVKKQEYCKEKAARLCQARWRGRQGRVDGAAGLEGVSVLLRGCSVMAAERLALLRCSCVHLCVLVCAGVCWLPAGVCVCVCVCE